MTGKFCEHEICQSQAIACAALTAFNGEVLSHKYLCDIHAQEIFSINLDRVTEEMLDKKVEKIVRAQQLEDKP